MNIPSSPSLFPLPASEGNSQFPLKPGKPIQVTPTHGQPHPKSQGSTQGSTQHQGDRKEPWQGPACDHTAPNHWGLLIFLFALDFSIRNPWERINIYLGVKLFIQLSTPCKSSAESSAPCTSIQAVLHAPGDQHLERDNPKNAHKEQMWAGRSCQRHGANPSLATSTEFGFIGGN